MSDLLSLGFNDFELNATCLKPYFDLMVCEAYFDLKGQDLLQVTVGGVVCGLFANNVVSFAAIVVLRLPLFAFIVGRKIACLQVEAFLFVGRYTYVSPFELPSHRNVCV